MSLFGMLKQNARRALRGNWGKAVLILLLYLGVALVYGVFTTTVSEAFVWGPLASNPTMTPQNPLDMLEAAFPQILALQVVGIVFSVMILYPYSLGISSWNLQVVRTGEEPFSGVFHFFEKARRYGRALLYSVNMLIRTTFWAVVFLSLPTAAMTAAAFYLRQFQLRTERQLALYAMIGIILSVTMTFLATALYIAYMMKYFLTPYLLAADDTMTVRQAIRQSARQTRGYRFNLLGFELSFLGWLILCVPLPPLLFYVLPYRNASMAMYAQYLMETLRRAEEQAPPPNATREFSATEARIQKVQAAPEEENAVSEDLFPLPSEPLDEEDPWPPAPLHNVAESEDPTEESPEAERSCKTPVGDEAPSWPDSPPSWDIPGYDNVPDSAGEEAEPGNGRSNSWPFED